MNTEELYKMRDLDIEKLNLDLDSLCNDILKIDFRSKSNMLLQMIINKLQQENLQLKQQLKEEQEEYDRIFGLWHNRKLIKRFDDEYSEEDKRKNPNRDYVGIIPDAEEVYKRYYEQQERINKAIEYIENNSLYETEYDYDYEENSYLSGIDDEIAKKDLLEILKGE